MNPSASRHENDDGPSYGLAFLHSLPDWERGTAGHEETYTLDRMENLLAALDRPDRAYPIVHVVGTKGKGSTATMIAGALRAAGCRVGLFTSPHLVRYNERIQVDGETIRTREIDRLVEERLGPAVDTLVAADTRPPLHFEAVCALALEYFRRRSVDVAVVEAGLGGRLDATNCVERTYLTVITTIGYDHMAVLGHSLASIAAEKAGVIRHGGRVVSTPQPAEALEVIERTCRERGASLGLVGRDWIVERVDERIDGTTVAVRDSSGLCLEASVPLVGAHQGTNAAVALAALLQLRELFPALTRTRIQDGLLSVRWPGRLQTIDDRPLLLLDGAHNKESAEALAGALKRLYPGGRFVLVLAVFIDKEIEVIVGPLLPLAERVIATEADHPRRLPAAMLAARIRECGPSIRVEEVATIPLALDEARAAAGPAGAILVTGSLRAVGEALAVVEARSQPHGER